MQKTLLIVCAALAASGCATTGVSTRSNPQGGGEATYRYQGSPTLSHQIRNSDRLMAEDCNRRNGGRAVIVDGQGQQTASSSLFKMRDQNRDIYYRCATESDAGQ